MELLALVARKAKHVVAMKLDRLFRDAADALNQTKAWDKAGSPLHLVDMGGQTLKRFGHGAVFPAMMAGFAELERNLIAESARLRPWPTRRRTGKPTPPRPTVTTARVTP